MPRISPSIRKKARRVKLLLLDLDGVLTDGGIVMDHRGREIKRFDVRDGHGIRLLQRAGIRVGIISGRSSGAARRRAKDLGIKLLYQGIDDKVAVYARIKRMTGLKDAEIAYVGDDLVDLPLLRRVGLAVTVHDCWKELKGSADWATTADGGRGAVREVAELLLKAQQKWKRVTQRYYLP